MSQTDLLPGFEDPVRDAASAFRVLLDAMARPGTARTVPAPRGVPPGFSPAMAAVALCLLDTDTPIWIGDPMITNEARAYIGFHAGAPAAATVERATFALLSVDAFADTAERLSIGTAEYPDRSATAILRVAGFSGEGGASLTGPGIETETRLAPLGLSRAAWDALIRNAALYPLGFDTIFVAEDTVACLPRSTMIRLEQE